MANEQPLFRGAFPAREEEEYSGEGKRPVVFDILGPDEATSILPAGIKMVLWVNPNSLTIKYTRKVERIQTLGGWVEQHWGDDTQAIDISMSTGGFMRLYTGLSNVTSPNTTGGTRRETLAYDTYLDMLALFHNNGSVYDISGKVALQGIIKLTFDGGVYLGWFNSFTVQESADKPYQFTMSASMDIKEEVQVWKSVVTYSTTVTTENVPSPAVGDFPLPTEGTNLA
jgi:hypothetical protein